MKNKQTRRLQTERQILSSALELIHEDGLTALTIDKISARSGSNKALIYRYFGGMDGLLEQIAQSDAFMPTIDELLDGWDPRAHRPKERFFILISKYASALRNRPATCEMILQGGRNFSPWLKTIEDARRPIARELCQRLGLSYETLGFSPDIAFSFMMAGIITFTSFQEAAQRFQADGGEPSALWQNLEDFFLSLGKDNEH